MTEASAETVMITGALGGLGYLLTRTFSAAGVSVIAVDNFDPGSEPLVLKRHRLRETNHLDNVRVHLMDVRSPEFASLLRATVQPLTLFHCARWTLPISEPCGEIQIREAAQGIPLTIYPHLANRTGARFVLFHHATSGDDLRKKNEVWAELFRAEEDLRNELSGDNNATFIQLPALVGPGQSSASPPLLTLVQWISRVPVAIPQPDEPVLAVDPSALAEEIVEITLAGETSFESFLRPFAVPPIHQFAEAFEEILEIPPVEAVSRQTPPWGPRVTGTVPVADVRTLTVRLIESLPSLPHLPPVDWPITGRRRSGKRSNRDNRQQ
ncbi:MAG: hypothetical protein V2A56_08580 [bacterium]